MSQQYCTPAKGVNLLNRSTNTEWRPIPPNALHPGMCVATILPDNPAMHSIFTIRSQYCYVPKKLAPSGSAPQKLREYLQTTSQQALKVMPSVKYDLDGIKIGMSKAIIRTEGTWLVEGSAGLTGDIIVRPENGNLLTVSINNKNGMFTFTNTAEQAKNNFLSSLKIGGFIPDVNPSLTIGASLTDKVSMTSTSISLNWESANRFKFTASFTPHYYEIKARPGLILETQMGYNFSGKATFYPTPTSGSPTIGERIENGFISLGIFSGIAILAAFSIPASLVGAGVTLVTTGA